jgi:hypothetical protein
MQTMNQSDILQQQPLNTNNKNKMLSNFPSSYALNKPGNDSDDIKVQIYYSGVITVIYVKADLDLELDLFKAKVRDVCKFDKEQPFTIKWVDEEGDPCTISSQIELDEALRLYHLNKENELIIHVFGNVPVRPGTQCTGEDRNIYRRGARRWRKIYLVNGHKYQAKRFARTALCKVCQDRIWGLGRQGYKCLECKIMVHKRCHKFILSHCDEVASNQLIGAQQQVGKPEVNSFVVHRISDNSQLANNSAGVSQLSSSNSFSSNISKKLNQSSNSLQQMQQQQKEDDSQSKNGTGYVVFV